MLVFGRCAKSGVARLPMLKLKRVVALIAIKDKQLMRSNYLAICILNKVL
jgi:hypothetical protein